MEPIEEQLRTLLVDIVRNCQSTVAHNFDLMNGQPGNTRAPAQPSFQDTRVAHAADSESSERASGSGEGTGDPGPNFFVEPPHLDEEVPSMSHCAQKLGSNLDQASDSGYGSLLSPCQCSCHFASGLSSTLYGRIHIRLGLRIYTDFLLQMAAARVVVLRPVVSGTS